MRPKRNGVRAVIDVVEGGEGEKRPTTESSQRVVFI